MDILKSFILDGTEHSVNVLWEDDTPFFRASEIGQILGLKNIHTTINDFDSDEKECHERQRKLSVAKASMVDGPALLRFSEVIFKASGIEYNIKTISEDNQVFYCAANIGSILQLKNINANMSFLPIRMKCMKAVKTNGGIQKLWFLSKEGLLNILSKTRSVNGIKLAKHLNMNINEYIPVCDERENLTHITQAFMGETMHTQFTVLRYKIDLYFPKYKLAIEFDERFHSLQIAADQQREVEISTELGCTFIRFTKTDNIFEIINRIFKHIHVCKSATLNGTLGAR